MKTERHFQYESLLQKNKPSKIMSYLKYTPKFKLFTGIVPLLY